MPTIWSSPENHASDPVVPTSERSNKVALGTIRLCAVPTDGLARLGRPINATHGAGKEETRCAPACHRKGVSNVHCGAIQSQSSRIQDVTHQHTAFAEGNEGIPRPRADLHNACRKRRMYGSPYR